MPGTTTHTPAIYEKNMYKVFFETTKLKAEDVVYNKIFQVKNGVKGGGDKITQLLPLGDLVRHLAEGQDIVYRSGAQGWPFYVKYHTFSDGAKLTYEAIEDSIKVDNYLKDLAKTWTESSIDAKESLASRVFNHGGTLAGDFVCNGTHLDQTDPSGDLMPDSKPYFTLSGNNYTTKGGATYYNSVADITLSVANYKTIYNLHSATNAYTESGRPIQNAVDTLLTRRGSDYQEALTILTTKEGLPGGQLNDRNIWYETATPMKWAYLTDSAFYVGKRNTEFMQFHQRKYGIFSYREDANNKGALADYIERFGILLMRRMFSRGGGSSA